MKKIVSLFLLIFMIVGSACLSDSVCATDETAGITSVTYNEETSSVSIVSDTNYTDAVVYAMAYRNQKLVAIESATETIYAASDLSPDTDIYFDKFDSKNTDYVKVMVFKSKLSFSPLCGVYDFNEQYLSKYRESYAYIIDSFYETMIDEMNGKVTLRLVTKNGLAEYLISDNIKFTDCDGVGTVVCPDDMISDIDNVLEGTSWDSLIAEYTTVGDALYNAFCKDIVPNDTDDAALRTVYLGFNSDGEISSITPLVNTSDNDLYIDYRSIEGVYDSESRSVGTKSFSYNAEVIYIDYREPSNTKYIRKSSLIDGWEYSGLAVNATDGEYKCAVVTDYSGDYIKGDSFAVVQGTYRSIDSYGNEIAKVKVIKDGEEETLIFNDNVLLGNIYGSHTNYEVLSIGSVILYSADAHNNVYAYDVVGNVTFYVGNKTFSFDEGFKNTHSMWSNYSNGATFFYGYIADRNSHSINMCISDSVSDGGEASDMTKVYANGDSGSYIDTLYMSTRNANMYTLTGTRKNTSKVMYGDYIYGNVGEMYLSDDNGTITAEDDQYEVYYVLAKMYEGVVTDIISFHVTENYVSIITPFDSTPCE